MSVVAGGGRTPATGTRHRSGGAGGRLPGVAAGPAAARSTPTDAPADGALARALAAEHAAIYAYGLIGARADAADTGPAREAEAAHRRLRDRLVVLLDERGATVPAAEAAYELPFPVTDPSDARRLAVLVEERVAVVWRAALPELPASEREQALTALVDAAVRATRWRLAAGVDPATTAFPGAP